MAITTAVLVLAGGCTMFFSSSMRPEPKFSPAPENGGVMARYDDQELKDFIKSDRDEGNSRLLITLLCVGGAIEIIVFLAAYYFSQKIVRPVQDAYNKQKLFIANASHELKTPLAVIEANVEALEVEKSSKKWKTNIENEIGRANKLVLDLLQLAKMDAGSVESGTAEEVDLDKEIKEHIELFSPKFAGKMTYKSSGAAKSFLVVKQDFSQVLDILLDNATKYGEKKILVELREDGVLVANDGAKIAKEDVERIFDRFYQSDKTKEGSGLGLAIAKAIAERNKWKISCNSDDKMTKFMVKVA